MCTLALMWYTLQAIKRHIIRYLNQYWYFWGLLGWRRDQGEVCGDELIPSWEVELIIMLHLTPLLDHIGINLLDVVLGAIPRLLQGCLTFELLTNDGNS